MRGLLLGLACAMLVPLLGCDNGTAANDDAALFAPANRPVASSPAERDSALALLDRMQRSAFDSAFVHLDRYGFVRSMRTEQRTASGAVTAWTERTLRYPADGTAPRVLNSDSMGAFTGTTLGPLGPSSAPKPQPPNAATYAFPEDAAYLSERTQGAFQYTLRPNTSIDGQAARVVEIHPKQTPDGRDQVIRFARLTIARGTHQLLAAHTVRSERVLLFQEDSELILRLQRSPDRQTWVPAVSRFRTRVDVPLRDPQQFRTASTYTDYVRPRS